MFAGDGELADELADPGREMQLCRVDLVAARELRDVLDDHVHAPALILDNAQQARLFRALVGGFVEQLGGV